MSFTALRDAAPLPPGRERRAILPRAAARAGARPPSALAATAMRAPRRRCASSTTCTQRAERDFANIERDSPVVLSAGGPARRRRRQRPPPRLPRQQAGAAVIEPGNVAPTPRTRRRRRLHRRARPHADLRRQEVHPLALLRDVGPEGLHRQREGAVDQSRRDAGRRAGRDRARVRRRAPFATSARTGSPTKRPPPVNLISRARRRAVRDPRRHPARRRAARLAIAPRCAAAARRRTSRSATARTTRSSFAASGEPPTGKADMLPVRDGAARDRSADRRAAAGARQPGDHQRHRPRGRARRAGARCAAAAAAPTSRSATAATRASASARKGTAPDC